MKIATVHAGTFGEVSVGECFKVKNKVYMKTENINTVTTKINSIDLATGTFTYYFKDSDPIVPVNATMVENYQPEV
jgi:hypothetical protein